MNEATEEAYQLHMDVLEGLEQAINGNGTTMDEMEKKLFSEGPASQI